MSQSPHLDNTRRVLNQLRMGALEPASFEILLGVLNDVLGSLNEDAIHDLRVEFAEALRFSPYAGEVIDFIDGHLALRDLETAR